MTLHYTDYILYSPALPRYNIFVVIGQNCSIWHSELTQNIICTFFCWLIVLIVLFLQYCLTIDMIHVNVPISPHTIYFNTYNNIMTKNYAT